MPAPAADLGATGAGGAPAVGCVDAAGTGAGRMAAPGSYGPGYHSVPSGLSLGTLGDGGAGTGATTGFGVGAITGAGTGTAAGFAES